jgi:predicted ATPase
VHPSSASTSILGRDIEARDCADLLRQQRWISIVAPGGMGKTALARDIQARVSTAYSDGSHFVDLTTVQSGAQMVNAIARTLSIGPVGPDPLQSLCDGLKNRHVVLVLDNVENLPSEDGRATFETLLTQAPHLALLLTTRMPFGHDWEVVRQLAGLSLTPDETGVSPAEALFVREARKVFPGVRVDGPSAAHIRSICEMTGGMPLAIELAAAWARLLTPEIIADQLRHSIDWLSTSHGFGYSPQRSIRGVLDYFWSRLTEHERAQLRPLAVFRSGFDAELANAVGGASAPFLQKLRQHAFLTQSDDDRFHLHELLRQYLDEKLLSDTASAHQAQRRLADAMRALAIRAERVLEGDGHTAMMRRLASEHGNIEVALLWFKAQDDVDAVSDIANGIALFWEFAGHGPSMVHWHTWAIERSAADTPERLLRKFALQMNHSSLMNEMDLLDAERKSALAAQATLAQLATLSVDLNMRAQHAHVALALAHNSREIGDLAGLEEYSEIGLRLAQQGDDVLAITWGMGLRASALYAAGDYAAATVQHDERLALLRANGIPTRLCIGLISALYAAIQTNDLARAARLSAEANVIATETPDIYTTIAVTEAAAALSEAAGDLMAAERQLLTCIAMDQQRAPVCSADARIALARVRLSIGGDAVTPLREGLSYALSHAQRAPQIEGLLVAARIRLSDGDASGAHDLLSTCLACPSATAAHKAEARALMAGSPAQHAQLPGSAPMPLERSVAGVLGALGTTMAASERSAIMVH